MIWTCVCVCVSLNRTQVQALASSTHARAHDSRRLTWVFITGGCSGRGVEWIGVALCNKLVYNSILFTIPCFHCAPLWCILSWLDWPARGCWTVCRRPPEAAPGRSSGTSRRHSPPRPVRTYIILCSCTYYSIDSTEHILYSFMYSIYIYIYTHRYSVYTLYTYIIV